MTFVFGDVVAAEVAESQVVMSIARGTSPERAFDGCVQP